MASKIYFLAQFYIYVLSKSEKLRRVTPNRALSVRAFKNINLHVNVVRPVIPAQTHARKTKLVNLATTCRVNPYTK